MTLRETASGRIFFDDVPIEKYDEIFSRRGNGIFIIDGYVLPFYQSERIPWQHLKAYVLLICKQWENEQRACKMEADRRAKIERETGVEVTTRAAETSPLLCTTAYSAYCEESNIFHILDRTRGQKWKRGREGESPEEEVEVLYDGPSTFGVQNKENGGEEVSSSFGKRMSISCHHSPPPLPLPQQPAARSQRRLHLHHLQAVHQFLHFQAAHQCQERQPRSLKVRKERPPRGKCRCTWTTNTATKEEKIGTSR